MNTPAHILIGAAAFGRPGDWKIMLAAVAGALAPDLSLYLMAGWALHVDGHSPSFVFNELYYSQSWRTVFAIDNSVILWGLALLVGMWTRRDWLIAFSAAALLHLGADFLLHSGDGRPHFWPLTWWIYDSPVSYWDSRHHGGWVAPLAAVICVLAYVTLWRRGIGPWGRVLFGAVLLGEFWIARQWIMFF